MFSLLPSNIILPDIILSPKVNIPLFFIKPSVKFAFLFIITSSLEINDIF